MIEKMMEGDIADLVLNITTQRSSWLLADFSLFLEHYHSHHMIMMIIVISVTSAPPGRDWTQPQSARGRWAGWRSGAPEFFGDADGGYCGILPVMCSMDLGQSGVTCHDCNDHWTEDKDDDYDDNMRAAPLTRVEVSSQTNAPHSNLLAPEESVTSTLLEAKASVLSRFLGIFNILFHFLFINRFGYLLPVYVASVTICVTNLANINTVKEGEDVFKGDPEHAIISSLDSRE